MKNLKRVFSLMMAMVMCLGLMATGASAADVPYEGNHSSAITVTAVNTKGEVVPGVTYELVDTTAGRYNRMGSKVTDQNGVAQWTGLSSGYYTIIEQNVPYGYIKTTVTRDVTLNEGATSNQSIRIQTLEQKPVIAIYAYDVKGNPIAGVAYHMRNNVTGQEVATALTDASGFATTDILEPGVYTVIESIVPDGYVLMNSRQSNIVVNADEPTVVRFVHAIQSTIKMETVDMDSGEPITGAIYQVMRADNNFVGNFTTDRNGEAFTDQLAPGTYYVKQIVAPDGYLLNTTTQTIYVTANQLNLAKFFNKQQSCIVIQCVEQASTFGLSDCTFTVEHSSGKEVYHGTTDSTGILTTGLLEPGRYTVKQISTKDGYTCVQSSQTVEVTYDQPTTVKFENTLHYSIVIQLTDAATSAGIAGSKFLVEAIGGDFKTELVTDAAGQAHTDVLPDGTYMVHQETTDDAHILDRSYQWATLKTGDNSILHFVNYKVSGLVLQSVEEITRIGIPGTTFEVYEENGKLVKTVVTDATGTASINDLPTGFYEVKEVGVPKGYDARTATQKVKVSVNEPSTLVFAHTTTIGLRIINTCEQTGEPISGSTFKITSYDGRLVGNYTTNAAGIINVRLDTGIYTVYQTYVKDGYVRVEKAWNVVISGNKASTLEVENERESNIWIHVVDANSGNGIYGVSLEIVDYKNNRVGNFVTNNQGEVELTDILNEGKYEVRMLDAPSEYVKDNVPKTIVVNLGETTELTWKLDGLKGQVAIATFSGEDSAMMNIRKNSPISGAVYMITDANGRIVNMIQGNVNGVAYSGPLAVGTYFVQQVKAPTGYQLNGAQFSVRVSSTNDNIRAEVYNKAANYNASVQVHGQTTAVAGGSLKYWFNIQNNSTCAMDNFFVNLKLPTDAIRATTFYTGTYTNTQTTYSIQYKTNMNDYRTLASGLNSQSQYAYDLSTIGLGLSNGEYVTDIRLVFPTVVAGFRDSVSPVLDCYVLSTVANGTNASVRAEIGGLAEGYYSNNSRGGQWGTVNGQTLYSGNGWSYNYGSANSQYYPGAQTNSSNIGTSYNQPTSNAASWTAGAHQFTTYIYGYQQNVLPNTLPKTGY